MGKLFDRLEPAVKKETKNVFLYCAIGTIVMWIAFFVLNKIMPETVPFDYRIFTGGAGGMVIATLNFFLMGLTVTKVASEEDEKTARRILKNSYSKRMAMQLLWIVIALAVSGIFWVAGIIPLLFPSAGIKIKGIIEQRKYNRQEVEQKQDGC